MTDQRSLDAAIADIRKRYGLVNAREQRVLAEFGDHLLRGDRALLAQVEALKTAHGLGRQAIGRALLDLADQFGVIGLPAPADGGHAAKPPLPHQVPVGAPPQGRPVEDTTRRSGAPDLRPSSCPAQPGQHDDNSPGARRERDTQPKPDWLLHPEGEQDWRRILKGERTA